MNNQKDLLKKYNIRPSKHLGQNFLIDKSALNKIIEAGDLSPEDIILEVGPGLGVLTFELAKRVKRVLAVEKDRQMAAILREILAKNKIGNVEITESDILKINLTSSVIPASSRGGSAFGRNAGIQTEKNKAWIPASAGMTSKNFKVVANIPYYLTSPLIRKFLESENQPGLIVLLIQKEVAQRICAKPPKMSLLSVAVQFYAEPKIISYVSKKSFVPQPKVDSAIIKITPRRQEGIGCLERHPMPLISNEKFFTLVRSGFAHPRKQLLNNLSTGLKISREESEKFILRARLIPTMRPSELSVDNWLNLAWIIWGK